MQELANTLGVPAGTVIAWEDEREFPTKRYLKQMAALDARGPEAVIRRRKATVPTPSPTELPRTQRRDSPMAMLAEPELWRLVRKLAAHPELFRQVASLAEPFGDPADDAK